MKTLEIIFSDSANLLYLWYISKNILKNCKSQFSEKKKNKENNKWQLFLAKWNDVVQLISEDEFNKKWQIFCSAYANKSCIIRYLDSIVEKICKSIDK